MAVNGESEYFRTLPIQRSGTDLVQWTQISLTIGTRGTRSSGRQKRVQIRDGAASNTLGTAGLLSLPPHPPYPQEDGRESQKRSQEQLKGGLYRIRKKDERVDEKDQTK